jgi:peptidoglycan hydrolase-like protein with peptidoglycan-binding domain
MRISSFFPVVVLLTAPLSVAAAQTATQAPLRSREAIQPASVRAAQVRLSNLGMYTGAIDGTWDQGTQTAVEHFQASRELRQSGQLDGQTLAAMGLNPNVATAR